MNAADAYQTLVTTLVDPSAWPDVFAVWSTPPDSTAVPAVWCEMSGGGAYPITAGSLVPMRCALVVALAPTEYPVEYETMFAALDTIHAAARDRRPPGVRIDLDTGWRVDTVAVGGVDHSAIVYDVAVHYHPSC